MKVNSTSVQNGSKSATPKNPTANEPKRPTAEEIKARIKEKFGYEVGKSKEKKEKASPDVVVSIDSKGEKKVEDSGFGDIKNNDPTSDVTQEKLRGILRVGGFNFSDKERAALDAILNK